MGLLCPLLLGMLGASLPGCSGTSTTTTSVELYGTVTGQARLANGTPARGATVKARAVQLTTSAQGMPEYRILGATEVDSAGRFSLSLPEPGGFFLEILARLPEAGGAAPFPQIAFSRVEGRPDVDPLDLGKVSLAPSGSLTGKVILPEGLLARGPWIGLAGTSAFIRLEGSTPGDTLPFRLNALPPGDHVLHVLVQGDTMVQATKAAYTVGIESGITRDAGLLMQ